MKSLEKKLQHSIKDADKILSSDLGKIKGGNKDELSLPCQYCKAGCSTCQPGNS